MSEHIADGSNGAVVPSNPDELSPANLLSYFNGQNGHEIVKLAIGAWQAIQNATITTSSEEKKEQLKRQHDSWKLGMAIQGGLAGIVIISAVILAALGKMEATVAGFLGVALGYVLGKRTS